MALDGLTISNVVSEFNSTLIGARLYKIAQSESDELLLTLKGNSNQYRLTISANASLPLIYIGDTNKTSPLTAPNFCMLLRKHLNNGRIVAITQPGLERVIEFEIEHLNELGDLCRKKLIVELMGKHSNIIFTDDEYNILDSIKHISAQISSIREVLPGRKYFIPETSVKCDALSVSKEQFIETVFSKAQPLNKALYGSLVGFSPLIAQELCSICGIDSDTLANLIEPDVRLHIYKQFSYLIDSIKNNEYAPNIIFKGDEPIEFAPFELNLYTNDTGYRIQKCNSMSEVLKTFYAAKNDYTRIKQRSSDLYKSITTHLERNYKKADLQEKQLKDTEKREKYKLYGELLQAYGHSIISGSERCTVNNYYTNEDITIPLDKDLSPMENSTKYFDKYNKLKRTFSAVSEQLASTLDEIKHLESILNALDIAETEDDLFAIRNEMYESGYIKKQMASSKARKIVSVPIHYISSDGFDIYVGRNNYQNDELTFKFASNNDWWFHSKNIPGSHVILKTDGKEVPDRAFEEAAALAAYYSRGKEQGKVEIDYIEKKHIKKPNGSKPGFVVYYTNYSMIATPDISKLQKL